MALSWNWSMAPRTYANAETKPRSDRLHSTLLDGWPHISRCRATLEQRGIQFRPEEHYGTQLEIEKWNGDGGFLGSGDGREAGRQAYDQTIVRNRGPDQRVRWEDLRVRWSADAAGKYVRKEVVGTHIQKFNGHGGFLGSGDSCEEGRKTYDQTVGRNLGDDQGVRWDGLHNH
jgi:hypothetical protein